MNDPLKDKTPKMDAIVAILMERPADARDCPGAEQMAQYLEGSLAADKARQAKKHIARCATCYGQWRAASNALLWCEEPRSKTQKSRVSSIWEGLASHWGLWLGGGLSAALASLFVVSVMLPNLNDRPISIDGLPGELMSYGVNQSTLGEEWIWSAQSKDFSWLNTGQPTQPSEASVLVSPFKKGMVKTMQELGLNSPFWLDVGSDLVIDQSESKPCDAMVGLERCQIFEQIVFELGRWAMAVYSACHTPAANIPDEFWGKQLKKGQQLARQIEKDFPVLAESFPFNSLVNFDSIEESAVCKLVSNQIDGVLSQ